MTPIDPDLEEPGGSLHGERTDLAWSRSGLAVVGALALLARRIWVHGGEPGDAAVVVLLGIAGLGWAAGMLGWRLTHTRSAEPRPRDARELLGVAVGTVALAGAGLAFTFVNE